MKTTQRNKKEPFFHIAKRSSVAPWKAWLIRIVAGGVAILVCALIASLFTKDFDGFFVTMVEGCFKTPRRIWNLFQNMAILLCISLAVTPAFKMRFWNIGAEGQTLVSALAAAACAFYLKNSVPNSVLILIMAAASICAGMIWAVIPAIFKAKWNTNETLFTLMMNYIATYLVTFFISVWVTSGSGVLGMLPYGHFPKIAGQQYLLNIILTAVATVLLYVYLRFSKHGYELSVVGESVNTAKYIGINVKKVIVRTMLLSGALCGLAGLLLVAGTNYTVYADIVGGRGFTAIIVSWLANFNPIGMLITSFLIVFLQRGSSQVVTTYNLGTDTFGEVITGIFFLFIVGCEFFINYEIKFRADIAQKLLPKSAKKEEKK